MRSASPTPAPSRGLLYAALACGVAGLLFLGVAEWQRGDSVDVYYDPNQPGSAVLKPGYNLVLPVSMSVMCLFVWGIGALLIWQWRGDRQVSPS